jgi:hypothetical protein
MACGNCFVIGAYCLDVFGEAASSRGGVIEVDFLNGRVVQGDASESLKDATAQFGKVLPKFCQENGAEKADFLALLAVFDATTLERRVLLSVTDRNGHHSTTEYAGLPLKRLRVLDTLGRVRRVARHICPADG